MTLNVTKCLEKSDMVILILVLEKMSVLSKMLSEMSVLSSKNTISILQIRTHSL